MLQARSLSPSLKSNLVCCLLRIAVLNLRATLTGRCDYICVLLFKALALIFIYVDSYSYKVLPASLGLTRTVGHRTQPAEVTQIRADNATLHQRVATEGETN